MTKIKTSERRSIDSPSVAGHLLRTGKRFYSSSLEALKAHNRVGKSKKDSVKLENESILSPFKRPENTLTEMATASAFSDRQSETAGMFENTTATERR